MSGDLLYTVLVITAFTAFTIALAGGALYTGLKSSPRQHPEAMPKH